MYYNILNKFMKKFSHKHQRFSKNVTFPFIVKNKKSIFQKMFWKIKQQILEIIKLY